MIGFIHDRNAYHFRPYVQVVILLYYEGKTMSKTSYIEILDAATLALERIRILAGMHRKHNLDPDELSLICDLICDIAEFPILPEA